MRPLRLLLLLFCFIALPIFLTCVSIFSGRTSHVHSSSSLYESGASHFSALFSFHAPSSLFYPSAIISLTYDNSTFFIARPAAFGPDLPSRGLNGQLWVGRGFGDSTRNKDGQVSIAGWEFGCSDVLDSATDPGQVSVQEQASDKPLKTSMLSSSAKDRGRGSGADTATWPDDEVDSPHETVMPATSGDGTDDHLHRPLPDSNPATANRPGEPASQEKTVDRNKKPTHADIESLQESAEIAGKVVLLSRGHCGFLEKVKWAQRRGGIAVIIGDDEKGMQLTTMYARGDTSNITIPALFTSYTSAHLLSSLVPPEWAGDTAGQKDAKVSKSQNGGGVQVGTEGQARPSFTPAHGTATGSGTTKPSIVPAAGVDGNNRKGWVRSVLSSLGLGQPQRLHPGAEDSRRPPSSGNLDWVLLEEWEDDDAGRDLPGNGPPAPTKTASTITSPLRSTPSASPTSNDFVIGIQDWRDVDLIAPNSSDEQGGSQDHLNTKLKSSTSTSAPTTEPTGQLRGGSITPGSGEYKHDKDGGDQHDTGKSTQQQKQHDSVKLDASEQHSSSRPRFGFWKSGPSDDVEVSGSEKSPSYGHSNSDKTTGKTVDEGSQTGANPDQHDGLWVTLTPANVSTSPFFDTLLVLVVSPLVTLSVVYALLLLRSRIRRRRWRAPKSVVERLPVRTYHTMSTSSSTTSSQISSPHGSSVTSPLLRSVSPGRSRPRPRSQTTAGVLRATSAGTTRSTSPVTSIALEKSKRKSGKRKRYAGRQVECVVCLEEYVDGESRVMSLPCGHEFHAECITPWLVTRRRTCPICKGDVVRSMARTSGQLDDQTEPGEERSDDVQDRVVETINDSPSAAIPIPHSLDGDDDSDLERGRHEGLVSPMSTEDRAPRSAWRNIVGSVSALSGDTVWRQTPTPRDRSR